MHSIQKENHIFEEQVILGNVSLCHMSQVSCVAFFKFHKIVAIIISCTSVKCLKFTKYTKKKLFFIQICISYIKEKHSFEEIFVEKSLKKFNI